MMDDDLRTLYDGAKDVDHLVGAAESIVCQRLIFSFAFHGATGKHAIDYCTYNE